MAKRKKTIIAGPIVKTIILHGPGAAGRQAGQGGEVPHDLRRAEGHER